MSEIINQFKNRLSKEYAYHKGRCRGLDVLFEDIDNFLENHRIQEDQISDLTRRLSKAEKYKVSFYNCDVKRAALYDAVQELNATVSTLAYYFRGALPHEGSSAYSSHTRMDLNVIEDALKKSDEIFREVFDLPTRQEGKSKLTGESPEVRDTMKEPGDVF